QNPELQTPPAPPPNTIDRYRAHGGGRYTDPILLHARQTQFHTPTHPRADLAMPNNQPSTSIDIAILGAGAAGLMAAIFAGRTARAGHFADASIVALDGARTLGAKILVAGGGRCNVTHHEVSETAYAGSSRNAIRKVLRRFDVPRTVEFFRELGVELKREETGKLFPVTDSARTVLNALLGAVREAGAEIRHPWRVAGVEHEAGATHPFVVHPEDAAQAPIRARRIILATGGRALPRSGSDGAGYAFARALGHTVTERVFPALVPLTLPKDHFLCGLSGLTFDATLEVRGGGGKRLASFTNSTLCAHFGLSGPSVLDISRYYTDAKRDDAGATLHLNALPGETTESVDAALLGLDSQTVARWLKGRVAQRLGEALCAAAGVDGSTPGHGLTREARRRLAATLTALELPVTGDRGFTHAEVTAGGVPLSEIELRTMESRVTPGLHIIGEICDVDGRIGGFNFQWAWASGYVAGTAAAESLARAAAT
ncbi:MAG: aminoacetone oxidase family FAD-binding enzyme, partial [Planctomycetota bacterium]|nr:aminoacetone oxidase family FAD-binding enzyme [Planctomycetota bacterium]